MFKLLNKNLKKDTLKVLISLTCTQYIILITIFEIKGIYTDTWNVYGCM